MEAKLHSIIFGTHEGLLLTVRISGSKQLIKYKALGMLLTLGFKKKCMMVQGESGEGLEDEL